jgi:hypothetical protein
MVPSFLNYEFGLQAAQQFGGFHHPFIHNFAHMARPLNDNNVHFNHLPFAELGHHPHHNTDSNFVQGCVIECTCPCGKTK